MRIKIDNLIVNVPNTHAVKFNKQFCNLVSTAPNNDWVRIESKNSDFEIIQDEPQPEVKERLVDVVQQLLNADQKFNAIKAVKDATGCGLKPAKLFVDGMLPYKPELTITERVKDLLHAGKNFEAIDLFRAFAGCDTVSAKAFVNSIAQQKPVWLYEVESLILSGQFIDAIKLYRKSTESSLYDAKSACDDIRNEFRDNGRMT